jgi:hypothetical protein
MMCPKRIIARRETFHPFDSLFNVDACCELRSFKQAMVPPHSVAASETRSSQRVHKSFGRLAAQVC